MIEISPEAIVRSEFWDAWSMQTFFHQKEKNAPEADSSSRRASLWIESPEGASGRSRKPSSASLYSQRVACFIRGAQSRAFPLTLSNSFVDPTAVLSKSTGPSFGEAYSAGVQNDHRFVAISAPVLETTLHCSSGDLKLVVGLFRRSVWRGSKSWNCALWNDVRDRRGSS